MSDDFNVEKVCRAFGLYDDVGLSFLHGSFNRNWRVTSNVGEFILKQRPACSINDSIQEVTITEIIAANNIPTAAVRRTLDHSLCHIEDEYCYSMFDFIPGSRPDNVNGGIYKLGQAMGKFHQATMDDAIVSFAKHSLPSWTVVEWAKNCINNYINSQMDDECSSILLRYIREALLEVENFRFNLQLPQSFVHWDLHAGNAIIRADGVVVIIDYEYTHPDDRIADVANSLLLIAGLDLKMIDYKDPSSFIQCCEIELEIAVPFLESYCKSCRLTEEEINILPAYMQIAWIGWCLYTFNRDIRTLSKLPDSCHLPKWIESNKVVFRQKVSSIMAA